MRLKFTLICLAVTALFVVGCGGGSSSGGTTGGASGTESSSTVDSSSGAESTPQGKPPTKAAFIKQGDAICEKVPSEYREILSGLEAEAKKENKPKLTIPEGNAKAAVPPLYVAIDSLEELTPPKGEEQEAEAIIAALESAAKGLEAKPESKLTGPKSPFAEFQKLTTAYGFRFCSQL